MKDLTELSAEFKELEQTAQILRDRKNTDPRVVAAKKAYEEAVSTVTRESRMELQKTESKLAALRKELEQATLLDKQNREAGVIDYTKKLRYELVDRIERPRTENGIDWANARIVLARYGLKELWWNRSGSHWQDQLSGYVSHGGTLITAFYNPRALGGRGVEYDHLHEGGRLSRNLILANAKIINGFFGIPDVAENIVKNKTLIITNEPGS